MVTLGVMVLLEIGLIVAAAELWGWLDDRGRSKEVGFDIRHYKKTGERRSVR